MFCSVLLFFNTNQTSVRYIYQISRNIYADQHAFHLVIWSLLGQTLAPNPWQEDAINGFPLLSFPSNSSVPWRVDSHFWFTAIENGKFLYHTRLLKGNQFNKTFPFYYTLTRHHPELLCKFQRILQIDLHAVVFLYYLIFNGIRTCYGAVFVYFHV
jgi:hypothetical protein